MFWLLYLVTSVSDNYGSIYSDDYSRLIKVSESFSGDFIVDSRVQFILGESGEDKENSPFYHCKDKLRSITFSPGSLITYIAKSCFRSSSIITADFSECSLLKEMNNGIFFDCQKLSTLKLPPNLETISYGAFYRTYALKRVELPDSVLGFAGWHESYSRVFGESGLEEIVISDSSNLKYILSDVFSAAHLKSFYIPRNCTNIDPSAFASCPIEQFTIHPLNTKFKTDGTKLFTGNNNNTLFFVSYFLTGTITIPSYVEYLAGSVMRGCKFDNINAHDNVKSFNQWAFAGNLITYFKFPPLINTIPGSCFYSCSELVTVELTENITKILNSAFFNCYKLKNINLPSKLELLAVNCFVNCVVLEELSLPENLTTLEDGFFSNCPKLKIKSQNPNIIISGNLMFIDSGSTLSGFFGSGKAMNVTIPSSCTKLGKNVFILKNLDQVTFEDSPYMTVGANAFDGSSVKSITFPRGLTQLDNYAMRNCQSLTTVNFDPNSNLSSIPDYCFFNDKKLKTITLPISVQIIGHYAFSGCSSISDIGLSNTQISSINSYAFYQSSLTLAVLPSTISSIGIRAFRESDIISFSCYCNISLECCHSCSCLSSLTLSDNVFMIDANAFENCISLVSFKLPRSVSRISSATFRGCSSLKSIDLPLNSLLSNVDAECFFGCINLKSINVDSNDRKLRFENGALTDYNQTKLISFLPYSEIQNFVVPSDTESIGPCAFMGSAYLMRVLFNGIKIKSIGYRAFKDCKRLNLLFFSSDSLSNIGNEAFDGCVNLNRCGSIQIPSSKQSKFTNIGFKPIVFSQLCSDSYYVSCKESPYINIKYISPFIVLFII